GIEQDGTATWSSTTMILVLAHAADHTGIGYTYGDVSTASFIRSTLVEVVVGGDPQWPARHWARMQQAIRNAGRPGLGAIAVSAVDIALWDLCAQLRDLPLCLTLPAAHHSDPVYG